MDALVIVAIVALAGAAGWVVYALISGKKGMLNFALATLAGAGIFLAIAAMRSFGTFKAKALKDIEKALADIAKAKADAAAVAEHDKIRKDAAQKAEEQIAANQKLIDAIKKALANN
jgi:hypothetical protein